MLKRQQLVTPKPGVNCNSGVNSVTSVTVHETANTSPGANAASHANLQSKGNSRNASWHWTVDDHEAVQSFSHSVRCWHSSTNSGNNTSVAVEICVNSDGNYLVAVQNAAVLVADILKGAGLSTADVVDHCYWSGKNCPTRLRSGSWGITWSEFLALVESSLHPSPENTEPEPEQDEPMYFLARLSTSPDVYIGDGMTRRHVKSTEELSDLIYRIQTGAFKGDPNVQVVDRIDWLGQDITPAS